VLDAVVFDLDGTLTDPAVGITGSFRHALAAVGHPAAADLDLTWMIGPSMAENLTRYGLPPELHAEAVAVYRERHVAVGLYEATVVPGVVAVLDALVADGVPLAMATAKPEEQGRATLDHFGLADRFAAVAGSRADGLPRPKAEIVAEALDHLGVVGSPRVAMVGDRRHDIEGGRANGCTTVAVGWGFDEPGELDAARPDHRVDDPPGLLAVLTALAAAG
jgi:phosphoglycolate phosphatase